ncbi:MAG: GNAT family N-acetyltransferase [Spirochaetaceae bacterium]|jgi:phosphinothricin acetyltransferase|nr:GNAT family N-acetyltransferase [Spirochaetaceae bacterium]
MIRPVTLGDAPAICGIYNHYVKNTVITFEERPVSIHEMEGRIREITPVFPWVVWEEAAGIAGYAYIHRWKERSAYRFSVEDSIYLKKGYEGKGIGKRLLSTLLEEIKKTDVHAVVAAITIPNDRSIGLHEKFGFVKIARFPEIGYKLDTWLDVGYWELLL